MAMPTIFEKLAAPFAQSEIHWRAQNITHDGTKALALAYVDARDVMRRLDEVVGPENWQDTYTETRSGRVICNLSIRIGDEWITKSDGAGETAIEGEKGGISDAFKRAAVKWGIARYLYDLGNIWAPCECYKGNDGKWRWKKWTADPWNFVRQAPVDDGGPKQAPEQKAIHDMMVDQQIARIKAMTEMDELRGYWQALHTEQPDVYHDARVIEAKDERKKQLEECA